MYCHKQQEQGMALYLTLLYVPVTAFNIFYYVHITLIELDFRINAMYS